MHLTIRRKIILLTLLPITLIYVIVFAVAISQMREGARRDLARYMTELAEKYASQIDGLFREVAQVAASTATLVETDDDLDERQISAQLRANVGVSDLIYGSAIAFEPGAYPGKELFGPYVYRASGGLEEIDIARDAYDYTTGEWEWWSGPRAAGAAVWTEPYFGEGAGNILMSTRAVPIQRDGAFVGVTTIDIPLDRLSRRLGFKAVGDRKFVILTPSGRYVHHFDAHLIGSTSIFEGANLDDRPEVKALGERMIAGERGAVRLPGGGIDAAHWVFYAPIPSTGWSFAARVDEDEAMAEVRGRIRWTAAVLAASLALIIASVWFVSGLLARPLLVAEKASARLGAARLARLEGMNTRLRILGASIGTMAGTASVVGLASIFFLYLAAREQERAALRENVQGQARLIDAVARFDRVHRDQAHPEGAEAATLEQVMDAHRHDQGMGETGEFTLARAEDGHIAYLLDRRHPTPSGIWPIPMSGTERAEPMRRALLGQSGTMMGTDYRGEDVVAAYAPVEELGLGLVAKMDLDEIRAPFVKAAMIAGLAGVLVISLGAMLMVRINNPLIRQVEDSENHLRTVLSTCHEGFWFIDTGTLTLDVNASMCAILGREREDILGRSVFSFVDEENREIFAEQVERRRRGEEGAYEIELQRPDGTRVPCFFSATPYFDDAGEQVGSFAMVTDITERKVKARSEQLIQSRDGVIFGLATLAESRDRETGEHLVRICRYTEILAAEIARSRPDLDEHWVQTITTTAALHDIGKVGVPDAVLLKDGRLTDEERVLIEKHTTIGGDTLLALKRRWGDDPFLVTAMEIVFAHHERWDGAGYPFGLAGDSIPLPARIVSVADVYDALRSKRHYKDGMPHERARDIIVEGAGSQFDPMVVEIFLRVEDDFRAVVVDEAD